MIWGVDDLWLRSPFAKSAGKNEREFLNHQPSAYYTKRRRICRFRICRPGFSSHKPDLSPDQAPLDTSRGTTRPCQGTEASRPKHAKCGANRPAASNKDMSWQQLIASNTPAHDSSEHAPRVGPRCAAWAGRKR